ncbi:MAG: hypothetical protein FWF71_00400 [Actinomycetia bacterium]|nr:hypothetical protein [Actinomycetes bacterium]
MPCWAASVLPPTKSSAAPDFYLFSESDLEVYDINTLWLTKRIQIISYKDQYGRDGEFVPID